ncbi:MAG: ribosome biogenesis GTP-binding protein YihA/YsxC [Rickettsiales bacterium]
MQREETAEGATIQEGRWLFSGQASFVAGVATPGAQLPIERFPDVVFAGRSNCGKSSLINALTFRKKLVRTSGTPGCTAQVNFFTLRDRAYLVDVPGYGYAKASKKEMIRWKNLIEFYFASRTDAIAATCILIDARRGVREEDENLALWLADKSVPLMFVVTKSDKATRAETDAALASAEAVHGGVRVAAPLATSARTGENAETLRALLAHAARSHKKLT